MSVHRPSKPSSSSLMSSPMNPLSHQCGDLEGCLVSLQNTIESRLKELEMKETLVNDRLRELEYREQEIRSLRSTVDIDCGWELGSIESGKKLLALLNEPVGEQEKLFERVRGALEASDEPGKLVLDAVGKFYCEDVEFGFVGKRSCVVLLEQLVKMGPIIGPAVKAEAAILAREWRAKIRVEGEKGVVEVLGFLLLLGAYDLVHEFDSDEMLGVFRSIGEKNRQFGGGICGDLGVEIGCADNDSDLGNTSPVSLEKTEQSLEKDLELVNHIASAFTSTFDALKCFCVAMDGKNLKLFLYQYAEEQGSWSTEVRDALCHAPDPAKLVLDAIPGFLRTQPGFHKKLAIGKVRKSCILLMEQLLSISPPISPNVREEALKLADEWGSNLGQIYQRPVTVYGFLLFLAAYRLEPKYEADELLRLLGIASQFKAFPRLCQALGLADKAEVIVQSLIQKPMLLEAVDNVYAYGLVDKFQPVRLLRGYLSYSKKRIYKKGQSSSQQKPAMNKEIAAIKNVLTYIAKYKLESKFPPRELEKQILELEKKMGQINDTAEQEKLKGDRKKNGPVPKGQVYDTAGSKKMKAAQKKNMPIPDLSSASTAIDSQVKVEPFPKEYVQLDDQVVKSEPSTNEELKLDSKVVKTEQPPAIDSREANQASLSSTSPWPRLECFCVSMYGKGLSFFSPKHRDKPDPVVSSSTSPWLELKTFCVNMDGKSLRTFIHDHMDENESFGCEIGAALKCASDPAKLVLDAMPGCLHSQPEFDESLKLKNVRNTRILLLEKMISISPQISPVVKEEAQNMANEWRSNLGHKYKAPDNVYGFLHFIAAYGLVSSFEEEDLLDLLVPANQHKASPNLCHILGFTAKAPVITEILIQKSLTLEAIEHIYSFWLVDKFTPVELLKNYLNSKKIHKDGTKSPSKKAIETEIAALRGAIKCIMKHKLESDLPPHELEQRVAELVLQNARLHDPGKSSSSASYSSSSFQNVQA